MTHIRFFIAHAAWVPERAATLARLLGQLESGGASTATPCTTRSVEVLRSRRREHASTWATRLWERCAEHDGPSVCLNDDVILHPDFVRICAAMIEAVPDRVLSLHTNIPGAEAVHGSWVRCYWTTGPGYILPPGYAAGLLDYAASLPHDFTALINEDNLLIHYAYERGEPAWAAIPAPMVHDVATKSTLGYDGHPNRTPTVPWDGRPRPHILDWPLTSSEFWRTAGIDPPLLENPWMKEEKLALFKAALRDGRHICAVCVERVGRFGDPKGVQICDSCLTLFEAMRRNGR